MSQVEVCFSPVLYPYKLTKENFIVVVVDIFRATTSICAALDHGVKEIIPAEGIDEAKKYKEEGYLVACERNGQVLNFAEIGNSPSDFLKESLKGKTIVFSTTNGTRAFNLAMADASKVAAGSFINAKSLADFLIAERQNVVVLCAAWKNLFNLEDAVFAGALAEKLLAAGFKTQCDSAKASLDLWETAKNDLGGYLAKSSHRNRLRHLVSDADYEFTLRPDSTRVTPLFDGRTITDASAPGQ